MLPTDVVEALRTSALTVAKAAQAVFKFCLQVWACLITHCVLAVMPPLLPPTLNLSTSPVLCCPANAAVRECRAAPPDAQPAGGAGLAAPEAALLGGGAGAAGACGRADEVGAGGAAVRGCGAPPWLPDSVDLLLLLCVVFCIQ